MASKNKEIQKEESSDLVIKFEYRIPKKFQYPLEVLSHYRRKSIEIIMKEAIDHELEYWDEEVAGLFKK